MYRPTSTWIKSIKSPKTYPKITVDQANQHYEVIVIGAGIFGTTTAHLLKQQGKKICLLEGNQIGSGVTSYSTAKLSAQQGCLYHQLLKSHGKEQARMYYDMNINGIDLVHSISETLGLNCEFERRSHITWTSTDKNMSLIEKEFDACQALGIPCDYMSSADLCNELPSTLKPLRGISFPNQAQFNPYRYCTALAEQIQGSDCQVFEHSRVTDVTIDGTHKVYVNDVQLTCDHVVFATHLPIMDRSMHFAMLEPTRSVCMAFELEPGSKGVSNMSISAESPTRSLRMYGDTLIVAGEGYKMGEADSEEKYAAMEKWTRDHFNVKKILSYWSAMDYVSSDHVPFIGQLYRGSSTMYTATGFSKWGLASGAIAGQIVTDLINNKVNAYQEFVDAKRWDLMHQWKGLAKENMHTSKHLIKDKIKNKIQAIDILQLKVGQGKICKVNGKTVGAFLDENREYHIVEPVCTHLGCDLVFNQGDNHYDCPCHGSQFDIDGNVIHGPAVKALKQHKDLTW